MKVEQKILSEIQSEFERRLYTEGYDRIVQCLGYLSEEEVWARPNVQTVSIGNLILHLGGNVRQWICAGLGQQEDIRKRDTEFSTEGGVSKVALMETIKRTIIDAQDVVEKLVVEDLAKIYKVQVYEESGLSIIVHVIEHFSYHIGQITYAVKSRKNIDTQYYKEDLG